MELEIGFYILLRVFICVFVLQLQESDQSALANLPRSCHSPIISGTIMFQIFPVNLKPLFNYKVFKFSGIILELIASKSFDVCNIVFTEKEELRGQKAFTNKNLSKHGLQETL